MRRKLPWVVAVAFGLSLAVAVPHRVLAQQSQKAPAESDPEKAIAAYEAALSVTTRAQQPGEWARTQNSLGEAYQNRTRGDRADNLEKSIAAYEAALTVFTRTQQPDDWASAQNNLGRAYGDRTRGDRADNLEKSIAAYEASLTVFTRTHRSGKWTPTQNNLGIAYGDRIRGDLADNLEKSIALHQAALTGYTRERFPVEWAAVQTNLGNRYRARIRGDLADNREKAIAALEAALTVRTRAQRPREWAEAQNSLANAYLYRIRGDRADNLERAIAGYTAALAVHTRTALPREWAETQNNLAVAYQSRIRGDRADNLEKAIAAFEAALTVLTRAALPRHWAQTQNNLGSAYQRRIRGDRADNLEKAIAAHEGALAIRTRTALPNDWAATQDDLGVAYADRLRGDRADNLERAIAAYESALTVFTRAQLPRYWADTQSNLGTAYRKRIRGDAADNLKKAIAAYEASLTVSTRAQLPRDHLHTGRLLGAALADARQWHKAGLVYADARGAFLQLFGLGLNEAEARDLIVEAGPMFADAAFAAAARGDLKAALDLANEGRARQLRVALRRQGVELPAEKRPRHDALTTELRGLEGIAASAKGAEAAAALDRVATLRKELADLIAPHLPQEAGLTREVVPEGGAVVVPVVTRLGGKVLIAANGGRADGPDPVVTVVDLPQLTSARLDQLMRGDGKTGGWLGAYQAQGGPRYAQWLAAIEGLGSELWALIGESMDRGLKARGLKSGARIAILPTAALGLLPLGLAQDPVSKRRLAETWEIVQAPSFEALATAAAQAAQTVAPSLAAAINPTGDLPFTETEGALVAARFAGRPQLKLDTSVATTDLVIAALKGKSHWHFASHGAFDWNDARQSGLVMRDGERLTVGRLIETQGSLGRPRLVVLSACETGLYDIDRNPDEFVGLPATFMQAGATGVVGSLWLVDDLATALLVAKLYDLHLGQPGGGLAPPTALRQAQAWLRNSTGTELEAYAGAAARQAKIDPTKLAELSSVLTRGQRTASSRFAGVWDALAGETRRAPQSNPAPGGKRPFEHPYFWAGFVYTGL
jgi:CHAT domain-containing protein